MADEDAPPVTLNGTTYPAFADGKYDVVILGTGLTNSLLAAILAVKKKMSVLHVDRNAYYGGEGASLQLQEVFQHFNRKHGLSDEELEAKFGNKRKYQIDLIPKLIMADGKLINFLVEKKVDQYVDFNVLDASFVFQKGGTIGKVPATGAEAVSTPLVGFFQKRRLKNFLQMLHGIDKEKIKLNPPKVVDFVDGPLGLRCKPLMETTTGGCQIDNVGGQAKESGQVLPGDIVTHIKTRDVRGEPYEEVMKVIKAAGRPLTITFQTPPAKRDEKFDLVTHSALELYEYWVLDENTQDFVSHAMGLYADNSHLTQPAYLAVAALDLYKRSVMRYAKSPFLFPKYGLGELPQGFSRVCALSNGVQSLRVAIEDIVVDEKTGKAAGVVLTYDGKTMAVSTGRVIASSEYFAGTAAATDGASKDDKPKPMAGKMRTSGQVVRSICLLNHRIPKAGDAEAVQIILPQKQTGRSHDIYVTCMGSSFNVAPKGFYVAIVSTAIETDCPLKEVEAGIQLLGPILERFDSVSDVLIPTSGDDGKDTNVFATSSFDATSHFETLINDLSTVYKRVTGERLDLDEKPADKATK